MIYQHLLLPPAASPSGPRFYVGLHLVGTTDDFELSEAEVRRLVCHALIQRLADRGLPEAVDSLLEMVKFYDRPQMETRPSAQLESRPVKVKFVGSRVATYPAVLELD